MSATELTNGTHVTLTTTLPGIPTGTHGTVHGSWATHTGVIFDTNPNYTRYVPTTHLRIDHPETLDDVELTTPERISFHAIAHHDDDEMTACSYDGCGTAALWWYEHNCGKLLNVCESHREINDSAMKRRKDKHPEMDWKCRTCKKPAPTPIPWRAL